MAENNTDNNTPKEMPGFKEELKNAFAIAKDRFTAF